ncbi:MAG: DUF488 domain-containing protein [Candidatus Omnitrophica bacterium]|nr:DUF488 domain-containing protein [Candidatus Omnitrophota bacterium]MDD5737792.1 DUF488 domain-containing protein [Candidatus Omnitrophota bacterium]
MSDNNIQCFTIGHSNHPTEKFISLLKAHNVKILVDVRSSPYSQYVPQFNRELLDRDLRNCGIRYVFLGEGLGARHTNPSLCFKDKAVPDFRLVRKIDLFQRDLRGLLDLIRQGGRVSIMCAEKDPFDCHRFVLVSYALQKEGVPVFHILEDGSLIANDQIEERLIGKYKINYQQGDLFSKQLTKEDAIEEGYVLRNKDIGYAQEQPRNNNGGY